MNEAQQARDEAVARVDANANKEWKVRAYEVVQYLASAEDEFTTDDVWAMLDSSAENTHERRAMGGVITRAARAGLIENTGRVKKSTRVVCHQNPKAVWRSLIR